MTSLHRTCCCTGEAECWELPHPCGWVAGNPVTHGDGLILTERDPAATRVRVQAYYKGEVTCPDPPGSMDLYVVEYELMPIELDFLYCELIPIIVEGEQLYAIRYTWGYMPEIYPWSNGPVLYREGKIQHCGGVDDHEGCFDNDDVEHDFCVYTRESICPLGPVKSLGHYGVSNTYYPHTGDSHWTTGSQGPIDSPYCNGIRICATEVEVNRNYCCCQFEGVSIGGCSSVSAASYQILQPGGSIGLCSADLVGWHDACDGGGIMLEEIEVLI